MTVNSTDGGITVFAQLVARLVELFSELIEAYKENR
jgi:hypothetical protein